MKPAYVSRRNLLFPKEYATETRHQSRNGPVRGAEFLTDWLLISSVNLARSEQGSVSLAQPTDGQQVFRADYRNLLLILLTSRVCNKRLCFFLDTFQHTGRLLNLKTPTDEVK